jgi:3-hydroxyacyl-[acyl-carrier-protein] dehydratase
MPALLVDPDAYDLTKVALAKEDILRVLPHRHEFEQVDLVRVLDPAERVIIAERRVRPDEFWVRGHVPGRPIFPGVLLLEALAQASAILYKKAVPEVGDRFIAFAGLDSVRFRGGVAPGDTLLLIGKGTEVSSHACRCATQALLGRRVVCEATILGVPLRS